MKIYIAAFYQSRKSQAENMGTAYARAAAIADCANNLESFHYIKDMPQLLNLVRRDKRTLFLDSGAYSMFTQKIGVNLQSYAKFIRDNQDAIHVASNLDAIGKPEQASYDNQKLLESYGVDIKPVHHARDADQWLKRYIDEGYDYIFLGGMVPESTGYLRDWLDHVWHLYLTNPDGTPRVKVHGFGLTVLSLMFRYPWYSVDSTSWVMRSMYGGVYLDMKQPNGAVRDFAVDFSNKSGRQKDLNSWHYYNLSKSEQHKILARLEELEATRVKNLEVEAELEAETGYKQGFNLQCLAESYGWRDHFNIDYFKRVQERRVYTFKRQQETLFT